MRFLRDAKGQPVVSRTSTHLLARRAVCKWWDAK